MKIRRFLTRKWKQIAEAVVSAIDRIRWSNSGKIKEEELSRIVELMTPDYFIILTRHKSHLSTYAISIANWFLTRRWGYWSHVLMNTEDTVVNDESFRLIEATGRTGVAYARVNDVFNCTSCALLKPKSMSLTEWTNVIDALKLAIGKPYDSLYDIADDSGLSCVELVRWALMRETNYAVDFANFERMVQEAKNITPQMFYDCGDFEPVFEIRR